MNRALRPAAAALLAVSVLTVPAAPADISPLDLPDRPIGWLALPDDSILAQPAPAREGILRICAEMGWAEREYRLRAALQERPRVTDPRLRARERSRIARLAVRAGRDGEAVLWIERIGAEEPFFSAAAALAELRLGRTEAGAARLERVLEEGGFDAPAADLLRYRLAGALGMSGETDRSIALYRSLAADRESRFRSSSRREAARLLFDSGDAGDALDLLREGYGASLADLTDRDLLSRAARYERGRGRNANAAALWSRLLETWPGDRRAREAYRVLLAMQEEGKTERNERLPLLGARASARSGRTDEALRILAPLLALPESDPLAGEAALEAGRALYEAGRFREALRRVLPLSAGEGASAREALLYVARCRKKSGEWRESIESYREYTRRYPSSSIAPEAGWEIAWRLRLAGENAEAADAFADLERLFPRSDYAVRAPLYRSFCLAATGRAGEAFQALEKMTGGGGGGKDREDALFWRAEALADRGEKEGAEEVYREVAEEYAETYYGIRAASRIGLRTVLPPPVGRGGDDPLLRWIRSWHGGAKGTEPDTNLLILYRDLGENDEARREANRLRKRHENDPEALLGIARECRRLGLFDRAIPCARRIQALAEKKGENALVPELLALIYPLGYLDRVEEAIRPYRVFGPFLVLALMRQESWFHEEAHSPADARGLLQVLPSTGRRIARALGEPDDFPSEELFRADRNIRYGLWYLQSLIDRYDGDLAVVASAYNAGEGMADLWRAGLTPGEPGGYIERLHFSETRDYVKRALAGYWIYRYLYQNIASELYQ
ncbi:MAG: transglycosylase SLT domain-containing protein [Candidatus Eisenbacteria bacterium]|nr:transglycosylase SLT domain-containing protein [Candidatus Eisenbacteria bacterium]